MTSVPLTPSQPNLLPPHTLRGGLNPRREPAGRRGSADRAISLTNDASNDSLRTLRTLRITINHARARSRRARPLRLAHAYSRRHVRRQPLRERIAVLSVRGGPLRVANDASRKPMTFHDLRGTGITWAAVRGDDALKIKQRAGHATFSTTEGYIREAENLQTTNFGTPFPALPADLMRAADDGSDPEDDGGADDEPEASGANVRARAVTDHHALATETATLDGAPYPAIAADNAHIHRLRFPAPPPVSVAFGDAGEGAAPPSPDPSSRSRAGAGRRVPTEASLAR